MTEMTFQYPQESIKEIDPNEEKVPALFAITHVETLRASLQKRN
jgi:hypothetical protein